MGKKTATLLKIKQASRRLKRLACRMTMLTVMTMFLIYPFTLSHKHRHHRHHRHAYSLLLLETKIVILREIQNQNDADDANDAESGIWYRDIPKTASLASSASLSSHKSSEGVWGTPQKCACG